MLASIWRRLLELVAVLVWPVVTICGLYWVGRPLARGVSHWIFFASPDKFLGVLFSIPTAIIVLALMIGIRRLRNFADAAIQRGLRVGPFDLPAVGGPSPSAPPSDGPPGAPSVPAPDSDTGGGVSTEGRP